VSDDGHAISYLALKRGTVVRASDGTEVGTVRKVQENLREHIFDGIVIDTPSGRRFVDAPEVEHIAERAVTLNITAAEVAALPAPQGMGRRIEHMTTVRRAKRLGRNLRKRWDQR
jgi:hypothetical protein